MSHQGLLPCLQHCHCHLLAIAITSPSPPPLSTPPRPPPLCDHHHVQGCPCSISTVIIPMSVSTAMAMRFSALLQPAQNRVFFSALPRPCALRGMYEHSLRCRSVNMARPGKDRERNLNCYKAIRVPTRI